MYNKLTTRLNEVLAIANLFELSADEYFTSFITETKNYNDKVSAKYVQYWLKKALKEINEAIQIKTNSLSSNF